MKNLYSLIFLGGLYASGCAKPKDMDVTAKPKEDLSDLLKKKLVEEKESEKPKDISDIVEEKTEKDNLRDKIESIVGRGKINGETAQIFITYYKSSNTKISGVVYDSLTTRELNIEKRYKTSSGERKISIRLRKFVNSEEINRIEISVADNGRINGSMELYGDDKFKNWYNYENGEQIYIIQNESQIKKIFENAERKWGDYFRMYEKDLKLIIEKRDRMYEKEIKKTQDSLEEAMK